MTTSEPRPRIRSECIGGDRPCPWVGCKHNLMLDITDIGSVRPAIARDEGRAVISIKRLTKYRQGGRHPTGQTLSEQLAEELIDLFEARPSCALDVADANPDGITLDQVGHLLGLTRERTRQIELAALTKLHRSEEVHQLNQETIACPT